jgi:hypothetical protein
MAVVVNYITQIINKILKSKGPKTFPWGTPDSMKKGNENIPEKHTKDCLLFK